MMLANLLAVAMIASGAGGAIAGGFGSESSVAYRSLESGKFEVPPATVEREAARRAVLQASEAARLRLSEESLTGPAGGVRVRLRGALQSALVLQEAGETNSPHCIDAESMAAVDGAER